MDSRVPRDVYDAVHDLVREYGAEKLAQRTGTPAGTIYNKANPNDTSHHKPTLADGIIWTNLSGDTRIAEAFCRSVGGVFVDLRGMEAQSDEALLDLLLARGKEQGESDAAMGEVLARGRITARDFGRLNKEEMEAIAARLAVLYRLEGMIRG